MFIFGGKLMRFFSLMLFAIFVLMLSACNDYSNPSTTFLPTSTNTNQNNVASMPKQQEGDDARPITNTQQPINSPSSFVNESAWLGTWKWDQTTKNDLSTIKIKNIKDGKLLFSLNAYHVTNPNSGEGHNGELADETVSLNGNEAIYKDQNSDFELHISMVDHQLTVMTKGKESPFGAFVEVDGRYSKVIEHTTSDSIIGDALKDQSFHVNFESLGDSEFITTIEKKNGNDQPHFYIKNENSMSELKYELEWSPILDSISAVSFRDVNGDNRKDIIVIVNFMTGAGQMGAIPFSQILIFKQTESGFLQDKTIEKKAMDGVPYRILSVQDVLIGLKTDSKDNVANAWKRLQPGTYKQVGSGELGGSTMTIKQSSGDGLIFSLDAFYAPNKEALNQGGVNIGNIDSGKATPSYSEMIFRDGKYELSIDMISSSNLYVRDNGESYFGQNVYVNGIYSLKK